MPVARFEMPDGRIGRFEVPDGTTPEQAQELIQQQLSQDMPTDQPKRGIGEATNAAIADVPRQLGLTGRYIAQGLAGLGGVVSDPLAYLSNKLLGTNLPTLRGATSQALDAAGVPNPKNALERVVGDASEQLVSTGGLLGGAKAAAGGVTGAGKAVIDSMQMSPGLQASSAIGSAVGGGTMRETGGNDAAQFIGSVGGGLAAPGIVYGLSKGTSAITNMVKGAKPQEMRVDIALENALKPTGLTMDDLASNVKAQLRNDVSSALKNNEQLSPAAMNRLIQYRLVGATPRAANLTLDPAEVTRLENLTRMGANSSDPILQELSRIKNQNAKVLTQNLNNLGADTADDAYSAGQKVIGALDKRGQAAKTVIGNKYDAAKATTGRYAEMDRVAFTNQVNDLLDQNMVGGKLTADVRNRINAIAQGNHPFDVNYVEQLKTNIAKLQRNSADNQEKYALGLVRQALDNTPISTSEGAASVDAFNSARRVNRIWRGIVDRTPALQAVEDGVAPDKFVKDYIIGSGNKSNFMDVASLKSNIKSSPEAMQAVRGQIAAHLKKAAIGTGQEDAMNFSQSAYRKALESIGDRKLGLFFTKDEIAQMKAIGDVAFAETFQPAGSAVNNSNSGTMLLSSLLDKLGSSTLLRKIPLGAEIVGNPVRNVSASFAAKPAMDINRGLVPRVQPQPMAPMLFAPTVGLLALPSK